MQAVAVPAGGAAWRGGSTPALNPMPLWRNNRKHQNDIAWPVGGAADTGAGTRAPLLALPCRSLLAAAAFYSLDTLV